MPSVSPPRSPESCVTDYFRIVVLFFKDFFINTARKYFYCFLMIRVSNSCLTESRKVSFKG